VTKADWEKLADMRAREAGILLAAGEFDGAYNLAGYAIESALKACIIKWMNNTNQWPERSFSTDCWQHNLQTLLRVADLENALKSAGQVEINWGVVKDWTEQSRYEHGKTVLVVQQFYQAIIDPKDGVLQWLKTHW
jgi:hypothetical protein